jgi:hypothetical protein
MEYHAYQLDERGHILDRRDLVCADDAHAIQGAHSAFPQSDFELWQGKRQVGIFAGDPLDETQPLLPGVS